MRIFLLPFIFIVLLILNASSFASEVISPQLKEMTGLHNETRAVQGQSPLKWSDTLAAYATQWVNHLAETQNCKMIHRPNKENSQFQQKYGENLFWSSASKTEGGEISLLNFTAKDVFTAWVIEEDYYNYQTNECEFEKDCGHYTQIVWHETKEVGCGIAICADKSQIWACNYSPRGNYLGEWPY